MAEYRRFGCRSDTLESLFPYPYQYGLRIGFMVAHTNLGCSVGWPIWIQLAPNSSHLKIYIYAFLILFICGAHL